MKCLCCHSFLWFMQIIYRLFVYVLTLEIQLSGGIEIPFAIFVYRSQARIWISNVIYRGLFVWQNGPKWLCRNRESACYLDLKNVIYKIHTYSTKMFVLLKHFFYERWTNDIIINTKYMMYQNISLTPTADPS
jgi:hypothetical protein